MASVSVPSVMRPPWPIARLLVLFVLVLALPLLGLLAWQGYRIAGEEESELNKQTIAIAQRVHSAVDQTLQSYLTILQTLATSPALAANDLQAVYSQARAAFDSAGLFASLSNPAGEELFNTRTPFGSPLPRAAGIDEPVLASKKPYVSGYVFCVVARRPVIMISVPVMKGTELVYVLSLSVDVAQFKELLDREKLPPEWTVGIADRDGVIIARSHLNDEFVGKSIPQGQAAHHDDKIGRAPNLEGFPAVISRKRSKIAGWGIAVLVPESVADAKVNQALLGYGVGVGLITAFGLLGAVCFGRVIAASLDRMQKAAEALGQGDTISFKPSFLKEGQAVEEALVQSGEQRKETESKLLRATERFMAAEEGASGYVYDWDAIADRGWRSGGFTRLLGWQPAEVPVSREAWRQLIHPEDRENFDRFLHAQDRVGVEFRVRHKDGHYVWVWDRGKLIWNEEGVLIRNVGSVIDITPRKALEEQQQLLLQELSHRSKNLLTVIQAVAGQTLSTSSSPAEAKEALGQRLEALARTYETLTRTPSYRAPIAAIVDDELSAFSSRTQVDGPPLFLNPGAAQTMALVVHELATNAAKYGALSVPEGLVAVRWGIEANGKGGTFHFSWRESGGPSVKSPEHSGFGSLLTGEIAAMQFRGEADRAFEKGGFRYRLVAPLRTVAAETKHSLPLAS